MPFHLEQFKFMLHFANNRIPLLDPFFRFLNYFDTPYFYFLLIPIIWLGVSYQWGLRIFYWSTLNSLINSSLKIAFAWPRPNTDLAEIGLFQPHSYGFPSGGAQGCMFLGGLLIYYWKSRAALPIGLLYILLISFSRLYLGVHYPTDVLGGWLFALILLYLFIKTKEPLDTFFKKQTAEFPLALTFFISTLFIILARDPHITYIMSACMGIAIGTYFSLKYHLFLPKPKNIKEGVGRSLIGIAILFTFVLLWPKGGTPLKAFTSALFMSLATSPICRILR